MAKKLIEFERYLKDVLDLRVTTKPWPQGTRLPFYLREQYKFFEMHILETPCLIMWDGSKGEPAPATVRKHMDQLRKNWDDAIVYARKQVTAYNRKRLIEHKVPFVVPGNQMYLPMLGIDLREHYRQVITEKPTLKPSTQALLLYLLLRRHPGDRITPTEMAQELDYTRMTMTRAFDELEAAELADIVQEGRERVLRVPEDKKELWEKAQPLMRSPVKKCSHARILVTDLPGSYAGLSALAYYSNIAFPTNSVLAVSQKEWKTLEKTKQIIELPTQESDTSEIEVWNYDPLLFAAKGAAASPGWIVDPRSLYLSLKDHSDERVQAALEEMMENVTW